MDNFEQILAGTTLNLWIPYRPQNVVAGLYHSCCVRVLIALVVSTFSRIFTVSQLSVCQPSVPIILQRFDSLLRNASQMPPRYATLQRLFPVLTKRHTSGTAPKQNPLSRPNPPRLIRQYITPQRLQFSREISLCVLQFGLLIHFFTSYIVEVAATAGPSMVPTLSAKGDWIAIDKRYRRGKGIRVGDVVDFMHPMVPGTGAVKRVVGMPGDFVVSNWRGDERVEFRREGLVKRTRDMMIQVRDSEHFGYS